MAITHRPLRRLLAATTLLGAVAAGPPARAQDDDIVDEGKAPAPPVRQILIAETNFDQWVFGNTSGAQAARNKIDALLRMQIDAVDRVHTLSEAQKAKLELAGRGDVVRFFGRIEEKRKEFALARVDQRKINDLMQELTPFRTALQAGLFGDGSFFSKAMKTTLDAEQAARYEESLRSRRDFRYGARVDLAVAALDNAAGLTADQRQRLRELIREETRPPKKFGPYDHQVVILQLAKLPDAKLGSVFNEAQRRLIGPLFDQARRLEPTLSRNDFLPDERRP
jgi:hypothetical protein